MPVISRGECESTFRPGRISKTMMCAGYYDGGCDACSGDSGGPLFSSARCSVGGTGLESVPRVIGIVSWGSKCAAKGKFGVYTDVSAVGDWILSKMPGGKLEQTSSPLAYVMAKPASG